MFEALGPDDMGLEKWEDFTKAIRSSKLVDPKYYLTVRVYFESGIRQTLRPYLDRPLIAEFDAQKDYVEVFYGNVGEAFKEQLTPGEAEAYERQAQRARRMRELLKTDPKAFYQEVGRLREARKQVAPPEKS